MLSYIIGIGSIVGMMILWVFVQDHWKKSFAEENSYDDALAGRTSCSGNGDCGCAGSCSRSNLSNTLNEKTN